MREECESLDVKGGESGKGNSERTRTTRIEISDLPDEEVVESAFGLEVGRRVEERVGNQAMDH